MPSASLGGSIQLVILDGLHSVLLDPHPQSSTQGTEVLSWIVGKRRFWRDDPVESRSRGNAFTINGFITMSEAQMIPTLASIVDHTMAEIPDPGSLC